MYSQQHGHNHRDEHAVQDVETQQRRGAHECAAQQAEPRIIACMMDYVLHTYIPAAGGLSVDMNGVR